MASPAVSGFLLPLVLCTSFRHALAFEFVIPSEGEESLILFPDVALAEILRMSLRKLSCGIFRAGKFRGSCDSEAVSQLEGNQPRSRPAVKRLERAQHLVAVGPQFVLPNPYNGIVGLRAK